jgi:uncharacterized integral membrane protein
MVYFYILLIALAAVPLALTIWRMRVATNIKKNGVYTIAVITRIRSLHTRPGASIDILTLEYRDKQFGKAYNGKATVAHQQYKMGDTIELVYLAEKPSKYAIDTKKGYTVILVFCILLFLFIVFAVYKLDGIMQPK